MRGGVEEALGKEGGSNAPLIIEFTGETEDIPSDNDEYCEAGGGEKHFVNHTAADVVNALESGRVILLNNSMDADLDYYAFMTCDNSSVLFAENHRLYVGNSLDAPLFGVSCSNV